MTQTDPILIAFFLSTSGHSGVDRAMQNLLPELCNRGYRVDLLKVRKHGPNLAAGHPNLNIIDLKTSHTYSALPTIVRYLRNNRPVVLLSDKDRVNRTALLARWLARSKCRLILSSGTTISIDLQNRGAFERWLQKTSMGKLYPFADKVIVTSRGVADDMASYTGLEHRHISVVPSPVIPDALLNTPQALPDHPWFGQQQAPVIISVGELGPRKDFPTLIRAFAAVRTEMDCRLVILGKGRLRQSLLDLADELGVAKDIDLPGFVDSPYHWLAHADLFAFSSRWEGLGFVLIEALAVGTPVVSTACPSGPEEILEQGKYGPLVPVGDHTALAKAMLDTLQQPLPAEQLKQAALPYTISAATDAYLDTMGLEHHT